MRKEIRRIQRKLKIFMLVALCLLLAIPAPVSAASASVKLNASKKTLAVGGSVKLTATVTGKSKSVTWKSSKTSVATVSKTGKVTAKKAGTATITAKANGKTAKCVITVVSWANVYAKWLAKYPSKTSTSYYDASYSPSDKSYVNDFLLYDLTDDGVPELITYTYVNFRWYIVRIYTCQSGKVKQLKFKDGGNAQLNDNASANGGYYFYICKKGHLHNNYSSGMASSETVYQYSGGKLCVYLTMDQVGTDSANAVYKKNGSTISKAKYSSLTSGCSSLSLKGYENTSSNRTLLKKGKCKVNG